MKIIFISDIHGLYNNLNVIEKKIETEKIDKLVVLGDLYYSGPSYNGNFKIESSKVKDFLTKHKKILICMKGNCDSDVDIKASDFPICSGLSILYIDGLNIYITHGNEYNIQKNRKFSNKDILVYGHEHIPYIKKQNDQIFINVGSISFPKDGNLPTYMIYENKNFTIYDIEGKIIDRLQIQ